MAKQLVPVQFGGGINTKVDPKQLQAGNLLALQNGQFSKEGQINKRFGYDILNTTIEGGGAITQGIELAEYKNELLLFDGNNIFSYLNATGNWSNRGTAISVITQDKHILNQSSSQQLNPDMAFLNNIEVYAWEDDRGGVRYSTLDSSTQAFALSDALLNITAQQPKCVAFQNQIFIFYTDGNSQIFYQTVNPYNPTVIQAPITIVTDGYNGFNGFPYDVQVVGDQLFVSYLGGSPNTGAIRLFFLDAGFNKSGSTDVNTTPNVPIQAGFHGAIALAGDSNNNVWVSWANGTQVYTSSFTYVNNPLLSTTLVDTVDARVLTAIEAPSPLSLHLHYEIYNIIPYNTQVKYNTISPTGTLGTATTIRSVGLASKAFKFNDNTFINTAYQSTLQATYFTFNTASSSDILANPTIIAKEAPSVGGGLLTNGMCPQTSNISTGVFKFANLQSGKLISEANTLFSLLGVNSTKLTFIPSNNFINATQANTLLIVGGILQGYDGISVTELGFHVYPEDISYTPSGSDGSLSTGTYQYMTQFEWTDNNGQIYRSAPSTIASVQVIATNHVQIQGPTLRLTQKKIAANRTNPSIVIYRTQANGTIFNRITSTLAPLLNDPDVDTWTFTDTLSDLSASSNEINYTTGGVLPNIAPPANSIITTYNNRVFLAGLSDKLEMWYSQSTVNNSNSNTIPPQFAAQLTVDVDPRGGDITALALLNQALIIFKYNQIFVLQGNGPDATGNNNDYGDPTLIPSDVGCINPNSIVITPMGLLFQSARGICELDQSLNVNYIGAPVEDYNDLNITSATLNSKDNQVIFTTSEGTALVYDYFFKQWATWTNHFAEDSIVYNNLFTYLKSDGHVYVQNRDKYMDGSSPIYLSWTLPNLSFAGLQGFQRVFSCYILGSYKGPHTLNVRVAYDFNENYTQSATISPSTNVSTWGSDVTWGASATWGGEYQLYQFKIDFNIQKCTTIRIQVSDNQTSNYNEGYAISSVVFEMAALPGGNRLPNNKTYGAQ